jgi:PAS domain S-box-containing protein
MQIPVRGTPEPSSQILERLAQRSRILSLLGQRLGGAATVRRVAETLLEAADELMRWDACALNLYSAELDMVTCIVAMDLIDGRRTEVTPAERDAALSPKLRQIISNGAQLILREGTPQLAPDSTPFGDTRRPSASLLFVPIRCAKRVTGVLTIQSYTPKAYTEEDLTTLQALADHGGGAIARVQAEGALRRTDELYRRAITNTGAVPYAYDYRNRSYVFVGEGIEQLTGYAPGEISDELWSRIIQESAMLGQAAGMDRQKATRRALAGELRSWRCEMRILTREGKSRWISDAAVQNLDAAGRPAGSLGILEDITDRKRAEIFAGALSSLGQSLMAATTAAEAARSIANVADELFGWDACDVHLYASERNEINPVLYVDSINGRRVDVTPPRSEEPASAVDRRVVKKGAELILKDGPSLAMDPDAIPYGDKSRPSASIMRVPVRLKTRQLSAIVAFHSYSPQAYDEKDLGTLQILANCCSAAFDRA